MKVLLIFTYEYSLKTWEDSGTLSRELSIYKELENTYGHSFTFLTYGDETDFECNLEGTNINVVPIYKYIKKSKIKFVNFIKTFYFAITYRKKFNDIDLIKQNQLLGSWVSIILKVLNKIPLFTRTGYDMYKFSLEQNNKKLIHFLYLYLTKFTIKYSDLYSLSNAEDLNFYKKQYSLDKFILRQNWVLSVETSDFEDREKNKILSVGRLEKQKNLFYTLNELSKFDFEVDIVGEGNDLDELIKESKKLDIKVNFLGKISNENLVNLYSNYKYFISSSLYEGHPKTVIEAMSSGCIVFLSSIPNHVELVDDGMNGFIFDLETNKLRNKIKTVLDNNYDLKQISNNAINTTREKFNLQKISNLENEDYKFLKKL